MTISCSQNEEPKCPSFENEDGRMIFFDPLEDLASRGTITENGLYNFNVCWYPTGSVSSGVELSNNSGAKIAKSGGNWVYSSGTKGYWPNDGTRYDFFAVSPLKNGNRLEYDKEKKCVKMTNYTLTKDDLVYAVTTNRGEEDGKVPLYFKQALSTICFNLVKPNGYSFCLDGIKVCNVKNKGNLILCNSTTNNANDDEFLCKWECIGENTVLPAFDGFMSHLRNDIPVYGSGDNIGKEVIIPWSNFSDDDFYMIPQKVEAWDPTKNKIPTQQDGAYLLVSCSVYLTKDDGKAHRAYQHLWGDYTEFEKEDWTKRSGEVEGKEVAIPISINWEPGKKYTYTLNLRFGIGYDPETGEPAVEFEKFENPLPDPDGIRQ